MSSFEVCLWVCCCQLFCLLKGLLTLMVCRPENQGLRERMNLLEDLKEFDEGAKGCSHYLVWSHSHKRHICALLANFIITACGAFVDHCLQWKFCESYFKQLGWTWFNFHHVQFPLRSLLDCQYLFSLVCVWQGNQPTREHNSLNQQSTSMEAMSKKVSNYMLQMAQMGKLSTTLFLPFVQAKTTYFKNFHFSIRPLDPFIVVNVMNFISIWHGF